MPKCLSESCTMRILHLEGNRYPADALDSLESQAEVNYFDSCNQVELTRHLVNNSYQVIFTRLGLSINRDIIASQPDLHYVVTPTTGLDHIDIDACDLNKIKVVSLKGETEFLNEIKSTAEHCWALLLALIRHIPWAHQDVIHGNWRRESFLSQELNGKTLGIMGYGRLGKIVAGYGKAFGMRILAYDVNNDVFDDQVQGSSLEEVLTQSDVITIHIPSNSRNYKCINAEFFEKIKKGAIFINTARGEVVDEQYLLKALNNKRIAGAAFGCFKS